MNRKKNYIMKKVSAFIAIMLSFVFACPVYSWDVHQVAGEGGNAVLEGDLSTAAGQKIYLDYINVLLRDITGHTTYAYGSYFCTGNLYMVNPAGFVFGPGSVVQAANIVVSTLNISNLAFLDGCRTGVFNFTGQGSYIINQGHLIPQPGGYVCLLSQAIRNEGTIQAALGHIILASGEKMTLALDDAGTISVAIDEGVETEIFGPDGQKMNSAIENTGIISADGGTVTLTAKSLNKVFDYAINNAGIIEAKSLQNKDGRIELIAPDGPIVSTGTLNTSFLYERGASFDVGGVFSPGHSDIKNKDGATVFFADTLVSGTIADIGDIVINPGVTLNMTGDTIFIAGGSFLMDSTAAINGGGHDLTIYAGDHSVIFTRSPWSSLTNIPNFIIESGTFSGFPPSGIVPKTGGAGVWILSPGTVAGASTLGNIHDVNTLTLGEASPFFHSSSAPSAAQAFNSPALLVEELTRSTDTTFINDHRFVSVNVERPFFYFYHPLTPVDGSAFDHITLDAGAYDFIDDSLSLRKDLSSYYGSR